MDDLMPYIVTGLVSISVAVIGQIVVMRRVDSDIASTKATVSKTEAETAELYGQLAAASGERLMAVEKRLADMEEKYANALIWTRALINQVSNLGAIPITLEESIANNQKRGSEKPTKPKGWSL